MAIQNHRITRRIAAALLSFVAVFAVMRALSSSSSPAPSVAESSERRPQPACCPGRRPSSGSARSRPRSGPAPTAPRTTPTSGSPTCRGCARPATRASTRRPRASCAGRCGSTRRASPRPAGSGSLALSRHDFRQGLALGERAQADQPLGRAQLRRDRRRPDRARPLRRRRADPAALGQPRAGALLLRPRLLLPRAARGPARGAGGDAPGCFGRRREPRELQLRRDADRDAAARRRPLRRRRARLPLGPRPRPRLSRPRPRAWPGSRPRAAISGRRSPATGGPWRGSRCPST